MKSRSSRFGRCVFVFFALLAGRLAGATDDWSFSLSPHVWVADIKPDSSLPNLPPATPPEVERFATKLTGAFMISGKVQHGSFGLFVVYDWLRLNTESTHPGPLFSAVELHSNFVHSTAALTWQVPTEASWQVQLLAGARFFSVSGQQVFTSGLLPGFTLNADRSWTDAVIGADVSHDLDDRWFVTGKLLLGGFGSGSNTMVDVLGGVGYRFDRNWSALLGYRYLREDFVQSAFSWKLTGKGALLGVTYRF